MTLYGIFNYSCYNVQMEENFRDILFDIITKRRLNSAVIYDPIKARILNAADIESLGLGVVSDRPRGPASEVIFKYHRIKI